MDTLKRDVVHALRGFRRSPAMALGVIATLAVALGLNATAFSAFNAYVFRPTAIPDVYSLHEFTWTSQAARFHPFSWREYEQLRGDGLGVFRDVVARRGQLIARMNGRTFLGELVTGNYFSMLGVPASMGRTLVPDDTAVPGGASVVVLSHAAWKRVFASDPAIVGTRIEIRGVPAEVVGVADEEFVGLDILPVDFWAPITSWSALLDGPDLFSAEQPQRLSVIGRLRPGVTHDSAKAALLLWAQRLTAELPLESRATTAVLLSLATRIPLSFEVGLAFAPVAVAFGLVLLTAAANIAGLMLSRATVRQREIAIRVSLGASRGHIVRQFLTESLLLAGAAAVGGFFVAGLTLDGGLRLLFATLPATAVDYIRLMPMPPDLRVFAFLLGAALVTALVFGALPALQATRRAESIVSHGSTDVHTSRLRHALVIAQVTVSALLVVVCGVLLRGSARLANIDLGVRTRDVIELRTRARDNTLLIDTLASSPLVQGIATTSHSTFATIGTARAAPVDRVGVPERRLRHRFASPEYFQVLDLDLVSGRPFTDVEARTEAPVVILSQDAAAQLWPGQNPVGRPIRLMTDTLPPGQGRPRPLKFPVAEVIGVARQVSTATDAADRPTVYLPTSPDNTANTWFLVRTMASTRQIDTLVSTGAPGAVDQLMPVDELANLRLYLFRAAYWLSGGVGAIALLLTISGVYGVLSYAVARRTKEIGIRVALGASSGSIMGLVVRQSLRLCAVGLAIGVGLALGVSTLLSSEIAMMKTFDVVAFGVGVVVVLAACLAAALSPARAATRVEPLQALRIE